MKNNGASDKMKTLILGKTRFTQHKGWRKGNQQGSFCTIFSINRFHKKRAKIWRAKGPLLIYFLPCLTWEHWKLKKSSGKQSCAYLGSRGIIDLWTYINIYHTILLLPKCSNLKKLHPSSYWREEQALSVSNRIWYYETMIMD